MVHGAEKYAHWGIEKILEPHQPISFYNVRFFEPDILNFNPISYSYFILIPLMVLNPAKAFAHRGASLNVVIPS
jgi:hypothetical protein